MTQPRYAPIEALDEVRPAKHLGVPYPWRAHRPAEHTPGATPERVRLGTAGPDQGYALLLAEQIRGELELGNGEHPEDALAVLVQVALRRAARFGRAPVRADLEVALRLLSYASTVSEETVNARRRLVTGASHDPWLRREVAELVPEDVLGATTSDAVVRSVDWIAAAS